MDIYRITRVDPKFYRPNVRYGTKQRVAANVKEVKEMNASRLWVSERWPDRPYLPVTVIIERAPAAEFFDCTAEFMGSEG